MSEKEATLEELEQAYEDFKRGGNAKAKLMVSQKETNNHAILILKDLIKRIEAGMVEVRKFEMFRYEELEDLRGEAVVWKPLKCFSYEITMEDVK